MAVDTVVGAVYDKLINTASVTTLVTKITANAADQEATQTDAPYLVIILDDLEREPTADGVKIANHGVSIDIYHEEIKDATDIANEIENVLEDYEGTHGSVKIQEMWLTNSLTARDEELEQHVYRMQFQVREDKS